MTAPVQASVAAPLAAQQQEEKKAAAPAGVGSAQSALASAAVAPKEEVVKTGLWAGIKSIPSRVAHAVKSFFVGIKNKVVGVCSWISGKVCAVGRFLRDKVFFRAAARKREADTKAKAEAEVAKAEAEVAKAEAEVAKAEAEVQAKRDAFKGWEKRKAAHEKAQAEELKAFEGKHAGFVGALRIALGAKRPVATKFEETAPVNPDEVAVADKK